MNHGVLRSWIQWIGVTVLVTACTGGGLRDGQTRETADLYVQLGVAYMREGQYDVALQKLQRALEVAPDYPEAHNALGVFYERLGDDQQADSHYQKAIRDFGTQPRAHNNYGVFLCRLGRYEEAQQNFLVAAKNPNYDSPEVAYTNAGNCARRSSDLEVAESAFRRALEHDPRFPAALLGLGQIYYARGNYLASRAYLRQYLQVARHTPESLWLGIQNERMLGNKDAVATYSLLLKHNFPEADQAEQLLNLEKDDSATQP